METSQNNQAESSAKIASGPEKFTHLHLHTAYSLLDGAIRIKDLMQHCKANGMDAVAMTDHGNMFGTIEFYKEAIKAGVKPIIGNEFYVSPGKMTEKRQIEKLADGNNYHLVVLATNKKGYENLIRLTSMSYTEGFYRKPRIDYEALAEHSEGLVVSTACLGGEVQRRLLDGREDDAARVAGKLKEIMGPDRFYLEIQNHGLPEEMQVAKGNVELSKRLDIPLVLTNDSHFLTRDDHKAQDILLRINQKKTIEDDLQFAFNPEFYVKSPAEMAKLFPELPEAMHNTMHIADMVDLNFEFGNPLLPRFDVPEGHTLETYMRELCLQGLKERYGNPSKEVLERFEFEYNVITSMDFPGYFLIVQDFINFAKARGIPVGPGRGSAAGSIVAYALGITDIDPIRFGLLFERFLNPDRKEMPDIDVDFCTSRREEVINYCREKYGRDKVGQIITYGTMAAKACLKDVARVFKLPFEEANQISRMFPDVLNISIEEALNQSPDLKQYSESGDLQKQIFTVAKTLEGNARHSGVHAAGVVIAPDPLDQIVPMATVTAKDGKEKSERVLVTQFDMTGLTDVGLVKMDFLGLRNLTVIQNAVNLIKERTGHCIDLTALPEDDRQTFAMLQKGDVRGVFQLETSSGMREFVIRLKPTCLDDLIDLIALFRPGPLSSGMSDSYINRKRGREETVYPHKRLEHILKETYGVIVYQEQVMLISREVGGFTPGESDALRKAMGKKKMDMVEAMKPKFLEGAAERGFEKSWAENIYEQMANFAQYGFNKSHSAAYAMIVYQTAYLKANYPTDYMCAVLNSEMDKIERLLPYLQTCREMNIEILQPDINNSTLEFSYEKENCIRFGLGATKNVGRSAVQSIMENRTRLGGKFSSFFEFVENVDLRLCNKRALEALIHSGAFASMNYTRKALAESLELAISHGQKFQSDRESGQASLFSMMTEQTLDEPIPRGEDVSEYDEKELLRREKEVLGFYFSGHPLDRYERTLKNLKLPRIEAVRKTASTGDRVEIPCVITGYTTKQNKNNRLFARVSIEDMSGTLEGIVFPAVLEKIKEQLQEDRPVLIDGRVERNPETESINLLIQDIKPLNKDSLEERLEKSLHVKLNSGNMNHDVVNKLVTVMKCFSGDLTVYFHLTSQEKQKPIVIRAHKSFGISYSKDVVERLSQINEVSGVYLSVGEHYRQLV